MATPSKKSLAAIVGATAAAGLFALTPSFEGTKLTTYKDLGGVMTYCTGATEGAMWGATYTPAQCKAQLDYDLARHADGVMTCLHVPLTDGQKIAFVDISYNIGVYAFCGSSMARKANSGDMRGACSSLLLWNKADGRVLAGLTRRREAEYKLCMNGVK